PAVARRGSGSAGGTSGIRRARSPGTAGGSGGRAPGVEDAFGELAYARAVDAVVLGPGPHGPAVVVTDDCAGLPSGLLRGCEFVLTRGEFGQPLLQLLALGGEGGQLGVGGVPVA